MSLESSCGVRTLARQEMGIPRHHSVPSAGILVGLEESTSGHRHLEKHLASTIRSLAAFEPLTHAAWSWRKGEQNDLGAFLHGLYVQSQRDISHKARLVGEPQASLDIGYLMRVPSSASTVHSPVHIASKIRLVSAMTDWLLGC